MLLEQRIWNCAIGTGENALVEKLQTYCDERGTSIDRVDFADFALQMVMGAERAGLLRNGQRSRNVGVLSQLLQRDVPSDEQDTEPATPHALSEHPVTESPIEELTAEQAAALRHQAAQRTGIHPGAPMPMPLVAPEVVAEINRRATEAQVTPEEGATPEQVGHQEDPNPEEDPKPTTDATPPRFFDCPHCGGAIERTPETTPV